MRLIAVDPGEKIIGVAISDPSGTVARPLTSFQHKARAADAERLAALAAEHEAEAILVGLALDANGEVGPQARHAERLAEAIRAITSLPVILHDESYSSQFAQSAMLAAGKKRRRSPSGSRGRTTQKTRVHAVAAAAILQSYLDAHSPSAT